MFSILDGREHFYQWDIDRQLIVDDESISEVHFANCLCFNALRCLVNSVNGINVVDVPNELLTEYMDIRVWGYDGEKTLHEATFEVKKRAKPSDYVYTEEEVKTWKEAHYNAGVYVYDVRIGEMDIVTMPYTQLGPIGGYINPSQEHSEPTIDNKAEFITYDEFEFYWCDNHSGGSFIIKPNETVIGGYTDLLNGIFYHTWYLATIHKEHIEIEHIQDNYIRFKVSKYLVPSRYYDKTRIPEMMCNVAKKVNSYSNLKNNTFCCSSNLVFDFQVPNIWGFDESEEEDVLRELAALEIQVAIPISANYKPFAYYDSSIKEETDGYFYCYFTNVEWDYQKLTASYQTTPEQGILRLQEQNQALLEQIEAIKAYIEMEE